MESLQNSDILLIMNNKILMVGIAALTVGVIGGYAIANTNIVDAPISNQRQADATPMGMHRMSGDSMMVNGNTNTGSMNNMDHMMSMMVQSEREFIDGMIPHHQEAVDTAKEVMARGGTTPEIKQLVQNIVVAQEKEIAEMKMWYKTWYKEAYKEDDKYKPMMRELSSLSGKELDQTFLEDMIMHHMGAIMMAQSVQPHIEHQEMEKLTQAIVTSQSAEIRQMRQMPR